MSEFTPCSKHCPAVTGKASGSVTYCPKQENARHKKFMAEHSGHRDWTRDKKHNWTQLDWRTGERVVLTRNKKGLFVPKIPQHPDDTDCCLDFGCCAKEIAQSPFAGIFAKLFNAATGKSSSVIPVKPGKARGDA